MDICSHHTVWLSSTHLAVSGQERPRTRIAEGLQVKTVVHWQSCMGKFTQCLSALCLALNSVQSFIFMSTKLIPNVKYISCVNVYIILDGRFLVECQILKFLYSPREGITYNARCQLLQLFFMEFHGIFFVDVAQVAHVVFYTSS